MLRYPDVSKDRICFVYANDMKPGDTGHASDLGDRGGTSRVLDHRIDARPNVGGELRRRPHAVALAAVAAHALRLVASAAHRLLGEQRARGHRHHHAGGAVVEEARDQLELLLGHPDQNFGAEGIEELDTAKGGTEIPGAVLKVEADPVGPRPRCRLDHEEFGHRQP